MSIPHHDKNYQATSRDGAIASNGDLNGSSRLDAVVLLDPFLSSCTHLSARTNSYKKMEGDNNNDKPKHQNHDDEMVMGKGSSSATLDSTPFSSARRFSSGLPSLQLEGDNGDEDEKRYDVLAANDVSGVFASDAITSDEKNDDSSSMEISTRKIRHECYSQHASGTEESSRFVHDIQNVVIEAEQSKGFLGNDGDTGTPRAVVDLRANHESRGKRKNKHDPIALTPPGMVPAREEIEKDPQRRPSSNNTSPSEEAMKPEKENKIAMSPPTVAPKRAEIEKHIQKPTRSPIDTTSLTSSSKFSTKQQAAKNADTRDTLIPTTEHSAPHSPDASSKSSHELTKRLEREARRIQKEAGIEMSPPSAAPMRVDIEAVRDSLQDSSSSMSVDAKEILEHLILSSDEELGALQVSSGTSLVEPAAPFEPPLSSLEGLEMKLRAEKKEMHRGVRDSKRERKLGLKKGRGINDGDTVNSEQVSSPVTSNSHLSPRVPPQRQRLKNRRRQRQEDEKQLDQVFGSSSREYDRLATPGAISVYPQPGSNHDIENDTTRSLMGSTVAPTLDTLTTNPAPPPQFADISRPSAAGFHMVNAEPVNEITRPPLVIAEQVASNRQLLSDNSDRPIQEDVQRKKQIICRLASAFFVTALLVTVMVLAVTLSSRTTPPTAAAITPVPSAPPTEPALAVPLSSVPSAGPSLRPSATDPDVPTTIAGVPITTAPDETPPPSLFWDPNTTTVIFDISSYTIPTEIGLLSRLIHLDLGSKHISGTIPTEVGMLTELLYMDFSFNFDLNGTLPTELGLLSRLTHLNIEFNSLTGPIPLEIGKLTALEKLDIRHNLLADTIPAEIGNLTRLVRLDLGLDPKALDSALIANYNRWSGSIPTSVGLLTQLTYLSFEQTRPLPSEVGLLDVLPSECGLLTNLKHLSLRENRLDGVIPSELGMLTQLETLNLGRNQLDGTIPYQLTHLTFLQVLKLDENRLQGPPPAGLASLEMLRSLDLRLNRLSGTMPSDICHIEGLQPVIDCKDVCCDCCSSGVPGLFGTCSRPEQCPPKS